MELGHTRQFSLVREPILVYFVKLQVPFIHSVMKMLTVIVFHKSQGFADLESSLM